MSRDAALDRDARAVLDLVAASGRPPMNQVTPAEARAASRASRALLGGEPPATRIRDLTIPGPAGAIAVRLYRPLGADDGDVLPLFLFLHGGGWVVGDVESGDWLCASLVERLGIAVMTVDYGLAPEHPFPAALDDCLAVQDWLFAHAAEIGARADRIAVGGDSAGGNLATLLALHARDVGGPAPCAQILIYPVVDLASEHPSYIRNGDGYMLSAELMRWFARAYVAAADPFDWRISPLRAPSLAGVAPALILSCGFDPLCDEAAAYADALERAGVAVRHVHFHGQIHGFALWGKAVAESGSALAVIADELRIRLHG